MFDYQVMSEEDAMRARYSLLKDGVYKAFITKCEPKVSKGSGNNQFEVSLEVIDDQGNKHPVRDFWIFTPKMMWKVIHGCRAAGVEDELNEKRLHPGMLEHKRVLVRITSQPGQEIPADKLNGKPPGSKYSDKNTIDDYLCEDLGVVDAPKNDFTNDEIPF